MKKIVIILFLLVIVHSSLVNAANSMNREFSPFEESYLNNGYKTIDNALRECKKHFNFREVKLPTSLPPVPFTHHFGRFNNIEGNENDDCEFEYLNEKDSKNHYWIDIRPVENKINFHNSKHIIRTYKLKDGTEALYLATPQNDGRSLGNFLVFEKNGWQYRLNIDSRIEDKITSNVLVEMAESVK
ncbi:hypothetical protein [Peribacillus butanolivorans]|uniref:hypothetical protein n=1 Tax=Peribacillus butanolivorans TaxID=421767 RepID=UPI0035DFD8CC